MLILLRHILEMLRAMQGELNDVRAAQLQIQTELNTILQILETGEVAGFRVTIDQPVKQE